MATVVVGFDIRSDSDDARRLVECTIRRFTGNDDATPDTAPGPLQIMVQAESHTDAMATAERCLAECAEELGTAEPWELLAVIRPE